MAIQNTDRLLINRGGASYYTKFEDILQVGDNDLALINSSGSSYKLTGSRLKAGDFGDNDLFLVNRGGQSFKCVGSEIKTSLGPPIIKPNPTWAFAGKNSNGSNFRLTIEAQDKPFNPTIPLTAILSLTAKNSLVSNVVGHEKLGGPTYNFNKWQNTGTGIAQLLTPDFTFSDGGNVISFDIFIPYTIEYNSGTASSITIFGNSTWEGVVRFSQSGIASNLTATKGFFCTDDYVSA